MKQIVLLMSLFAILVSGCDQQQDKPATVTEPETTETMNNTEQGDAGVTETVASEEVEVAEQPMEPEVVAEAEVEAAPVMSGEQVFKKYCFACHMTGAANAPKVGDVAAWEPRIAKGMDGLLMSAMEGVPNTAMMASGGCTACSEQELMSAIEFMVNQSQ